MGQVSLINSYASLQNFLDYRSTTDADSVDDGIAELILNSSSRFIDNYCNRTFYPRVETLLLDVPETDPLYVGDDLLAVTTLLNGDSDTISSSDYTLLSANLYPKWAIKIKDSSTVYWETDADNSAEQVISLTGYFGYHNEYAKRAWSSVGTLAVAITSTTALTFKLSDGHTLYPGSIVKIDNEILNASTITSSDTVSVVVRGDNGSTAATHVISTAVYVWNPQADIQQACLEIAAAVYRRRKGQYLTGAAQVTAAGVVITPQDVPGQAREILSKYVRVN